MKVKQKASKPKLVRRVVSNDEFEAAMARADVKSIIWSASRTYQKTLSKDDRWSCGLRALWRALGYYDPSYGQALTSSLHQFVRWECGDAVRVLTRQRAVSVPELYDCPAKESDPYVLDFLSALPPVKRGLIHQYYLEKKSVEQLSRERGCTEQAIRNLLRDGLELLKQHYLEAA